MKKLNIIMAALLVILFSGTAFGEGNFLQYRYEESDSAHSHRVLFETSSAITDWALGLEIISGMGFKLTKPYFFHSLVFPWFELGCRYSADSHENEFIIPTARVKKFFPVFGIPFGNIATLDYGLNAKDGKNNYEFWDSAMLSAGEKWKVGEEFRVIGDFDLWNFQWRYLRVERKLFAGASGFMMAQRQWTDGSHSGDSGFGGITIVW